jgi:hypothetical protein
MGAHYDYDLLLRGGKGCPWTLGPQAGGHDHPDPSRQPTGIRRNTPHREGITGELREPSNRSLDLGYIAWGISWSSSVPPDKYRDSTLYYARNASFHTRSNSLFTNHPIARYYLSGIMAASLNQP